MSKQADAPDTLNKFLHEVGVPHEIYTDGGKELTQGNMKRRLQSHKYIPQLQN